MGFTLGKKTYIFNTGDQLDYFTDGDGSAADDKLSIKGLVTLQKGKIASFAQKAPIAAVMSGITFTVPTAAELGVTADQTGVSFKVVVASTRDSAEWSKDRIEKGRPFIVEILVDVTDAGADIAASLKAALDEYNSKYPANRLPFAVAASGADVTLTILDNGDADHLIFQNIVTFTNPELIAPVRVAGTVSKNTEAAVTGKQLEESVRMSLPSTSDLYGITGGQLPVLGASYGYIEITADDNWADSGVDGAYKVHAGLGGTKDEAVGDRIHTFLIFYNPDSSSLMTKINDIMSFLNA